MMLNEYLKDTFGCKVYKIALNGGFTCPNRDGTLDTRGCIFCSAGGSGEFSESPTLSVTGQIEHGKLRVADKIKDGKYIAYFQAYTGTYAPMEKLRKLYTEAIDHPDIAALSIATRPDCLGISKPGSDNSELLDFLSELNKIKPVWIELGLQTIHEKTAEYIRRGYKRHVYDACVKELRNRGIQVITHVILGLPGETKEDMIETVRYVCGGADGIKLQLLHILRGTDLEKEYEAGRVRVLTEDEYIDILKACVEVIPDDIVIHRLTGDGDKKSLIAPLWSADKKHVINRINNEIIKRRRTVVKTDTIKVFTQNSIRITGEIGTIYIDPFRMNEEPKDADFILVTHDHFDHFNPEDIAKVADSGKTVLVVPENMKEKAEDVADLVCGIYTVTPGNSYAISGSDALCETDPAIEGDDNRPEAGENPTPEKALVFETIPAYNIGKHFHPKGAGWVGYIIDVDGQRIYIAGDTDATPEAKNVKCDVALIPIGGTYTMDAEEAAELINLIKPEVAIPTHYGSVAGGSGDGKVFASKVDGAINVEIKIRL